jgi:hypothetical protein
VAPADEGPGSAAQAAWLEAMPTARPIILEAFDGAMASFSLTPMRCDCGKHDHACSFPDAISVN